jgi:hypothetical protein
MLDAGTTLGVIAGVPIRKTSVNINTKTSDKIIQKTIERITKTTGKTYSKIRPKDILIVDEAARKMILGVPDATSKIDMILTNCEGYNKSFMIDNTLVNIYSFSGNKYDFIESYMKTVVFTVDGIIYDINNNCLYEMCFGKTTAVDHVYKHATFIIPNSYFVDNAEPITFYRLLSIMGENIGIIDGALEDHIEYFCEIMPYVDKIPKQIVTNYLLEFIGKNLPSAPFRFMAEYDVCPQPFHYIKEAYNTKQSGRTPKHYTNRSLFDHMIWSLDRSSMITTDRIYRFCAFLHDIGKVKTSQDFCEDKPHNVRGTLYFLYKIFPYLEFDEYEIDTIARSIYYHEKLLTPEVYQLRYEDPYKYGAVYVTALSDSADRRFI